MERNLHLVKVNGTSNFSIVEIKDGKPEVIGEIRLYNKISKTPDFEDEDTIRVYV